MLSKEKSVSWQSMNVSKVQSAKQSHRHVVISRIMECRVDLVGETDTSAGRESVRAPKLLLGLRVGLSL